MYGSSTHPVLVMPHVSHAVGLVSPGIPQDSVRKALFADTNLSAALLIDDLHGHKLLVSRRMHCKCRTLLLNSLDLRSGRQPYTMSDDRGLWVLLSAKLLLPPISPVAGGIAQDTTPQQISSDGDSLRLLMMSRSYAAYKVVWTSHMSRSCLKRS